MNELAKNRDTTIDCMKGIGITLMVIGHSGFYYTDFIYLFHMSVFFMISGYLWNDRYSKSLAAAKNYILRKIKTLWLPFVLWNLAMLLGNNLFLCLHIYTDDPSALSLDPGITAHAHMTLKEMILPAVKLLFFRTDQELGGASWFLACLFLVSVLHLAVRYLCNHSVHGKGIFLLISISSFLYCQLCCMGITFPNNLLIRRALFAYSSYLMGYYFRKYQKSDKEKRFSIVLFVSSLGVLLIALHLRWANAIGHATSENVLIYGLVNTAGWFFCREPSLWIPRNLKNAIAYLGKHSLSIVLCHFLAFKLVSWIYVLTSGKSPLLIAAFPTITTDIPGWIWIVYTLAGIAVSLLFGWIGRTVKVFFQSFRLKKKTIEV